VTDLLRKRDEELLTLRARVQELEKALAESEKARAAAESALQRLCTQLSARR
jgi:hypothetical protein